MDSSTASASPSPDANPASLQRTATNNSWWTLATHRYPFLLFGLAWILGIYLAGQFPHAGTIALISTVMMIAGTSAASFLSRLNDARMTINLTLILAWLTIAATATWYHITFRPPDHDSLSHLAQREARPIALRGVITQAAIWSPNPYHRPVDPDSQAWSTKWAVQWDEMRNGQDWCPIQSRSFLYTQGRIDELFPGDRIEVFANLMAIAQPSNPGVYDVSRRARSQGMFVMVNSSDASQIGRIDSTYKYPLQRVRALAVYYFDRALCRRVAFDQAPLAAALVFGQREQVDWQSQQQLMATGTLHMLAISGLHVDLIATTLLILCQLLSVRRGRVVVIVIAVCAAYAGLAGGNPPVLRALVMIVAFSLAKYWGHNPRLVNLLALAGWILLLLNPDNLMNPGVQLSFLAVSTIAIFGGSSVLDRRDALQSLLESTLPWWKRSALTVGRRILAGLNLSFWIGLMTCPLIWYHFHVISIVSVPLNVVLSPFLVVGLLSGMLVGIVDWLPGCGILTGTIAGSSLEAIQQLVSASYHLPASHLWLPAPPLWWSTLFYAIPTFWLLRDRRHRRVGLAIAMVSWLSVGIGLQATGPRGFLGGLSRLTSSSQPASLCCTFIDVGHGTSVILELPDGRVWLYDAGHLAASERSHQVIASSLWSLPTASIDTLIISHADADHYNATVGLLERFRVNRVVSTKRFWESSAPEVQAVQHAIAQANVASEQWNADTPAVAAGQANIQVVHPSADYRGETDNADSLCLQIEYAGVRILLPGDIEGSGLIQLCDLPPRQCHLLMAPHHGSLSHDVSALLAWCRPDLVVISGNERAMRPQVVQSYADARQLGITFAHGAIQVRVSPSGQMHALRWNRDHWTDLE